MENGPGMDANIEERPRSAALDIALPVDLEVEKEHDHWRNPEVKPQVGAHQSSVVEGVDGTVSAWVADEYNRALGHELSPEEEKQHAELLRQEKELGEWRKFDVYARRKTGSVSEQIAQTRWVFTWNMADGGKSVPGSRSQGWHCGHLGDASVLDHPAFRQYRSVQIRNGNSGTPTSRTRFRRQMDSPGMYLFRHSLSGGPCAVIAFGNFAHQRVG